MLRKHSDGEKLLRWIFALIPFVLLLLLSVYLLIYYAPGARNLLISKPANTPTVIPTSTKGINLSPQAAWGASAASETLSTKLDASHGFLADSVTTDGNDLLGEEVTSGNNVSYQSGTLDIATRQFHPFGLQSIECIHVEICDPRCCKNAGDYLVATDNNGNNNTNTCSQCYGRYWSYNLDTKQVHMVTEDSDNGGVINTFAGHNMLILSTQSKGILVADLTSQTISPLLGKPQSVQMMNLWAFSWPYVIYSPASTTFSIRVHDLATGQDNVLSALNTILPAAVAINSPSAVEAMVIAGDTLFVDVASNQGLIRNSGDRYGLTTLYQLDHFPTATTQPITISTYPAGLGGEFGGTVAANDRLVIVGNLAWDRTERQWIELAPVTTNGITPQISLSGSYLSVVQFTNSQNPAMSEQVTIYNTDKLPVL